MQTIHKPNGHSRDPIQLHRVMPRKTRKNSGPFVPATAAAQHLRSTQKTISLWLFNRTSFGRWPTSHQPHIVVRHFGGITARLPPGARMISSCGSSGVRENSGPSWPVTRLTYSSTEYFDEVVATPSPIKHQVIRMLQSTLLTLPLAEPNRCSRADRR